MGAFALARGSLRYALAVGRAFLGGRMESGFQLGWRELNDFGESASWLTGSPDGGEVACECFWGARRETFR